MKPVETSAKKLLQLIGIEKFKLVLKEEEKICHLTIQTEESDLLIGRAGENLSALQLMLRLLVYRESGEWQTILVNVNDWREKREEYLKKLASNLAQKVKFSGHEVQLSLLSPTERRIIHLYLANHPDVTTVSEGEGRERHLIIKPR